MPAPIAVFAFNRPEHLRRTLAALAANELAAQSDLTVFCDGPRTEKEKKLTDAVREIARTAAGFRSCSVVEREKNYGLATNIITGVSELFEKNDRLIVLEDDLLTAPYFLRYMNDGLELYADDPRVASIHGFLFPHAAAPAADTFFLLGADCLGWGTWKRAWSVFDPDAAVLLRQLKSRRQLAAFNRSWSYDYTGMLQDVANGRVSSWAVRWLASTWLHGMYTLYPSESLVYHAGSDGSGTNCGIESFFDVPLATRPISVEAVTVREDSIMARELRVFLRTLSGGSARVLLKTALRRFPLLLAGVRALKKRIRSGRQ